MKPLQTACVVAATVGGLLAVHAQTPTAEVAAVNARASALDADDYRFVQPVCTRCHTPEMFLHSVAGRSGRASSTR